MNRRSFIQRVAAIVVAPAALIEPVRTYIDMGKNLSSCPTLVMQVHDSIYVGDNEWHRFMLPYAPIDAEMSLKFAQKLAHVRYPRLEYPR